MNIIMKRQITYGLLAALMACGCQEEELNLKTSEPKSFTASIEDNYSGGSTKTALDENGNVLWKKGDQVSIFAGSTINQQYQITDDSDGKTSANLNQVSTSPGFVAGNELGNNVAYYPYSSNNAIAKSETAYKVSVVLPSTQTYAEASFANGAFPMAAITSSTNDMNLKFKNVLGGLKLQLKGAASIASISISGNNNEILYGAANVSLSTANIPSVVLTDASAKTITLDCGAGVQLNAETATPFIIALPPMTMASGFTVIVKDTEGKQMEIKTQKSQTITRSSLLRMPAVNYEGKKSDAANGYEYVDLGLSVMWATCNIGASKPEETGNYYAWGETETKSEYNWNNYIYCNGTCSSLTKYSIIGSRGQIDGSDGLIDGKKSLDAKDDVAVIRMGNQWRMPTNAEVKELLNNTSLTYIEINGVYGYKFQSKKTGYTDKWIFLPACGYKSGSEVITDAINIGERKYARYWTKELDTYYSFSAYGLGIYYNDNGYPSIVWNYSNNRMFGYPIRPVYSEDPTFGVSGISLNKEVASAYVGLSETLIATVSTTNDARNTTVEWISSNPEVVSVDYNGNITAIAPGIATISAKAAYADFSASCVVTVENQPSKTLEAVELGLSVRWANMNLGAQTIETYGDYYMWGGITTLYVPGYAQEKPQNHWYNNTNGYIWSNYKHCAESSESLLKYCPNSSYGNNDYTDTRIVLEAEDDAATSILGDKWRLPTIDEVNELVEGCIWTRAKYNGVSGWKVESVTTGKWIFFPFSGYRYYTSFSGSNSSGYYWTSSLDTSVPSRAKYLYIAESIEEKTDYRCYGLAIRPVTE